MKKAKTMDRLVEHILTISDEEIRSLRLRDAAEVLRIYFFIAGVLFVLTRGETFGRFVEREKLNRAALYLENNKDMNIGVLSERLGFASKEEFSEKFENFFLVKPERYWELAQIKARYSWENKQ
ncbi:MAG: hypothetical protein KAW12_16500 [Candidatus Aminicenantes bacterium]|nr:hypothetical protein [Candidatus Aminicenantes bacterium]